MSPDDRENALHKADLEWMALALAQRRHATCKKRSVGAILVMHDGTQFTTGYNTAVIGFTCRQAGCLITLEGKCVRTLHAELVAIAEAADRGVSTRGSTLYCTHSPCFACSKMLIAVGVSRVLYGDAGSDIKDVENLWDMTEWQLKQLV